MKTRKPSANNVVIVNCVSQLITTNTTTITIGFKLHSSWYWFFLLFLWRLSELCVDWWYLETAPSTLPLPRQSCSFWDSEYQLPQCLYGGAWNSGVSLLLRPLSTGERKKRTDKFATVYSWLLSCAQKQWRYLHRVYLFININDNIDNNIYNVTILLLGHLNLRINKIETAKHTKRQIPNSKQCVRFHCFSPQVLTRVIIILSN